MLQRIANKKDVADKTALTFALQENANKYVWALLPHISKENIESSLKEAVN